MPFTEKQRSIIIGSVLGDGCLHPNWSKTNYTLKITRSGKQEKYVEWEYENLQPFVRTAPRWYEPTRSYTMRTISHSELTELYKEFYPKGKKILPARLEEYMQDPLTMAVWFMDDGNAIRTDAYTHGYNLNTQSFTFAENELIARLFMELYGIRVKVEKNNGYFRLGTRGQESKEMFKNLVKDHMIPSMQYKLGYVSDSLRTRRD